MAFSSAPPPRPCVVPGGGLSPDGQRWVCCRPGLFLPVRVLSCLFRRLFLESLQKAFDAGKLQFFGALDSLREARGFARCIARAKNSEWVVYAKRPFAGPSRCSTMWAAIPTAWPSPTTGCWISKTVRSVSSGKTIGRTARPKR